jgi:hypothetical protein
VTCWRTLGEWQAVAPWHQRRLEVLAEPRVAERLNFSLASADGAAYRTHRGSRMRVSTSPTALNTYSCEAAIVLLTGQTPCASFLSL